MTEATRKEQVTRVTSECGAVNLPKKQSASTKSTHGRSDECESYENMINKGERGLQNCCRRLAVAVVPVVQVDFAKMETAIMNVLITSEIT